MSPGLIFKIVFAGDGGVGKTTMLHKYIEGRFLENTKVTLGVEIFNKNIRLSNDSNCALQLWDFGGQKQFRFLQDSFVLGADGAFLMFDLTVLFSFNNLRQWISVVRKYDPRLPIVLLGAKDDLENQSVQDSYVEDFLRGNSINSYLRISSKTGFNVEESFNLLIRKIMEYKNIL